MCVPPSCFLSKRQSIGEYYHCNLAPTSEENEKYQVEFISIHSTRSPWVRYDYHHTRNSVLLVFNQYVVEIIRSVTTTTASMKPLRDDQLGIFFL